MCGGPHQDLPTGRAAPDAASAPRMSRPVQSLEVVSSRVTAIAARSVAASVDQFRSRQPSMGRRFVPAPRRRPGAASREKPIRVIPMSLGRWDCYSTSCFPRGARLGGERRATRHLGRIERRCSGAAVPAPPGAGRNLGRGTPRSLEERPEARRPRGSVRGRARAGARELRRRLRGAGPGPRARGRVEARPPRQVHRGGREGRPRGRGHRSPLPSQPGHAARRRAERPRALSRLRVPAREDLAGADGRPADAGPRGGARRDGGRPGAGTRPRRRGGSPRFSSPRTCS